MSSESSAGGVKRRPAGPRDEGDDHVARRSMRPRLSEVVDIDPSQLSEHVEEGTNNTEPHTISTDLIFQIAHFMDIGQGLRNLCIAVGPADASMIRYDFLKDNDEFIVKALRRCQALRAVVHWKHAGWESSKQIIALFEKCREDIVDWMAVNEDWAHRCTIESLERYKTVRMEANLVFNNPAVAIEIGLIDVLRLLFERKNISVNVNAERWRGFTPTTGPFMDHLVCLALIRGDTAILQYILSLDGFQLSDAFDVRELSLGNCVNAECFDLFVRNEYVYHNVVYESVADPIRHSANGMFIRLLHGLAYNDIGETSQLRMSKIKSLLDIGVDPHFKGLYSPVVIAKGRLQLSYGNMEPIWREVLQMMTSWKRK